jgi:hypothetical protein
MRLRCTTHFSLSLPFSLSFFFPLLPPFFSTPLSFASLAYLLGIKEIDRSAPALGCQEEHILMMLLE